MRDARSDDLSALLRALVVANAELRQQLGAAQDMPMETGINAWQLQAQIEVLQAERDACRREAALPVQRHTSSA